MSHNLQFSFDNEFKKLGIAEIAFATIRGLNNQVSLPAYYDALIEDAERRALEMSEECLATSPVLLGYRDLIQHVKRSMKKFPPSARSLIDIVKRRASFPRINPVVDLYNVSALDSFLSLGVHDLNKLHGTISFRISKGGEIFFPIGGGEKITAQGDYLYADENNILAWLDARDSELVKVESQTRDLIIIIQGNLNTSLDSRLRVLSVVCRRIIDSCGGQSSISYVSVQSGLTTMLNSPG